MKLWMRRVALILYYIGAALLTLVLLLVNLRLYYPSGADYGPDRDGAERSFCRMQAFATKGK